MIHFFTAVVKIIIVTTVKLLNRVNLQEMHNTAEVNIENKGMKAVFKASD